MLDAIMMAIPALGLTKTVWAVDLLLECGVLGEDIPSDVDGKKWHDICPVDAHDDVQLLECGGRHVFAAYDAGAWRVFEAKCSHHGVSLAYSEVRGTTVECSLHGWRFNVKNGNCIRFGMKNLDELETRVD
jgi:nitrite reductase/ring-hydroxylating ferredoxin subunit